MAAPTKTHRHLGETIQPCDCLEAGRPYRWYVVTKHPGTGLAYSEPDCPHFVTLADAKRGILERAQRRGSQVGS